MDFDLSDEHQGLWFEYEDDPEPDPEKRAAFLIIPNNPLIEDKCRAKATTRPAQVNGRFRRQIALPDFNTGAYQRAVFVECCKGWRNIHDRSTGAPIPYDEEMKVKMSLAHKGAVDFVNDIAEALSTISEEQVREERAKFRNVVEVPNRPRQRELSDLSDPV